MSSDQQSISSKLRFMDPQTLFQYGEMHKANPYIFPLVFQESQNRKHLAMNRQMQAGAQPQPKVADQALAQMAPPQAQPMPEDRGIATLPAPNMKFGAEGGILGYEGYGEEPRQFGQESVLRMAEGGVARYNGATGSVTGVSPELLSKYRQEATEMGMGTRVQFSPDVKAVVGQIQAAQEDSYLKEEQQRMLAGGRFNAFPSGPTGDAKPANPAAMSAPTGYDPTENLKKLAKTDKYISTTPAAPNNAEEARLLNRYPTTKPVAKKDDTVSKADTTRRNTTDPSAARKEPAAEKDKEPTGLDALIKDFTRSTELAQGALNNRRVEVASQLEQEALGAKAEGEESRKKRGDVFATKEARLAEREKSIEGMGDKYMGLALLQAGAAMMSTPGNLGSVIGKGIQVGSERYVAGIDKINAAKDKFAEARDRLDDLRLNRDDMNEKEIREENRAVRNARIQGKQLFLEGATKDLEISNANMGKIFGVAADNLKTDKTIAADLKNTLIREGGANARANAPTSSMREAMLLGTGNTPEEKYLSGLRVMKELTGDKQGTQLLKLFLEENGRREKNMEKPLTLDQFRRTSAAFYAPPAPVDTTKPTRP
jgi:hypothetical protein